MDNHQPPQSMEDRVHYCHLCRHKVSSSKFISLTYDLLPKWQLLYPGLKYNDRLCDRHSLNDEMAEKIIQARKMEEERIQALVQSIPPMQLYNEIVALQQTVQMQNHVINQYANTIISNNQIIQQQQLIIGEVSALRFSVKLLENDDKATKYFTGIPTYAMFLDFFDSLRFNLKPLQFITHPPTTRDKQMTYSNEEKLFWALTRDRLNLGLEFFAHVTGASIGHISESIISMIKRIEGDITFLTGQELLPHTPFDYDIGGYKLQQNINYYSADFTYIHIQHSSDPEFAQMTWLDFKKGHYLLAGVINALDGTPMYMIPPVTSRPSQNTIWNTMHLNELFPKDKKNCVFVDKGMNEIKPSSNVEFLCMENAKTETVVNQKGKSVKRKIQATTMDVFKAKFIAHHRVVSERFFGNMKCWNLLAETVPNTSLSYIIDHFLFIGIMVKNFKYSS